MAKEEKKEKELPKEEKKEKEKGDGVITAVYKVNLHCQQCAREIQKPLMRIQGVHKVDFNMEKNEIQVKGMIDPKKIHERIEKLSKKKVELVSPKAKDGIATTAELLKDKIKESIATEKKDTKESIIRTTSVKVHMHCDKCEQDLRKKLLRHKGIYSVKTDMKAQTLTVEGIIEPDKLISYIRKRVNKHAEIIPPKVEKKEEKKEAEKKEEKKEAEKKVEKKEVEKVETKITETTKITEFKEETKVEVKDKDGKVPYFVHYVYAPQLFSDENPNACSVM